MVKTDYPSSDCSPSWILLFCHSNYKNLRPGPLGQSDAHSDWYSGGRGFDPLVRPLIFRRDFGSMHRNNMDRLTDRARNDKKLQENKFPILNL